MDWARAEREFRRLEELRSTGRISEDAYRGRLSGLRVTDLQGQIWMLQERTGRWHVLYGNQWLPATPPEGRAAIPSAPQAATPAAVGDGRHMLARWIGVWAAIWIVIAAIIYLVEGRDEPVALVGIGIAALLSLILMLVNLSDQWSGQVVDIRTERERARRDNGGWTDERVTYAYVRRDDGRVKRMRAMPGWEVGDRLVKRRGDSAIRKG